MIKTITLETGEKIELNSSMGWIYTYQENFGHDILVVLMPAIEAAMSAALEVVKASPDGSIGTHNLRMILDASDDDILTDAFIKLSGLQFTTLTNIIWSMAKNADETLPSPKEWLNKFESFPLDQIIPEALRMIIESSAQKKTCAKLLKGMKSLNQSRQTDSPLPESTEG